MNSEAAHAARSTKDRKETNADGNRRDRTETFDAEVLRSDKPVIVDFWAEWCGPCHAVAPVLDRIVEEHAGEVKLVKVNIDEQQRRSPSATGSPRSRR